MAKLVYFVQQMHKDNGRILAVLDLYESEKEANAMVEQMNAKVAESIKNIAMREELGDKIDSIKLYYASNILFYRNNPNKIMECADMMIKDVSAIEEQIPNFDATLIGTEFIYCPRILHKGE